MLTLLLVVGAVGLLGAGLLVVIALYHGPH